MMSQWRDSGVSGPRTGEDDAEYWKRVQLGYCKQRNSGLELLREALEVFASAVIRAGSVRGGGLMMKIEKYIKVMSNEEPGGVPEPLGGTRHTRDDHGRKIDEIIEYLRSQT
jgi:hypothetical protein